jgi:hypothetical protein
MGSSGLANSLFVCLPISAAFTRAPVVPIGRERAEAHCPKNGTSSISFSARAQKENSRGKRLVWISFNMMPQMTARGTRAFESDRKKTRQKISVRTVRVRQKFARALDDMRCRGSWIAVFLPVSRRFCCSQLSGEFIALR